MPKRVAVTQDSGRHFRLSIRLEMNPFSKKDKLRQVFTIVEIRSDIKR